LELEQKVVPSNSVRLVELHNEIGCVYSKLENYDEALKEHSFALQIQLDNNSVNYIVLAKIYNYIGTTYQNQGKFYQQKRLSTILHLDMNRAKKAEQDVTLFRSKL
jgi:tetratricopeptide (TPR) repeat protein